MAWMYTNVSKRVLEWDILLFQPKAYLCLDRPNQTKPKLTDRELTYAKIERQTTDESVSDAILTHFVLQVGLTDLLVVEKCGIRIDVGINTLVNKLSFGMNLFKQIINYKNLLDKSADFSWGPKHQVF